MIPLGISIMRDERPAGRLGGAIALMRASLCVGGALGLPIAALVADSFDWHVLFRVAAPAPALVLVLTIVPDSGVRAGAAAAFAALAVAAFLPTHRVAAVRRGAAV